VTEAIAQGEGCSSCSGGLGTYTYSRTFSPFADGFNSWNSSTEYLPCHRALISSAEPVLALAA
jgi:hypothetical protein